jgi:hypothetical protein
MPQLAPAHLAHRQRMAMWILFGPWRLANVAAHPMYRGPDACCVLWCSPGVSAHRLSMQLSFLLGERAAAGRPVRIGQVGAGKFGTMLLFAFSAGAGVQAAGRRRHALEEGRHRSRLFHRGTVETFRNTWPWAPTS